VVQVGAEVDNIKIGQKVMAFTDFGGYAEYTRCRKEGLVPLPESMTFEQGASIPVTFATAYHCLFQTGPLSPGDKVLIHSAAGGVGLAAVQLCLDAKCEIYGTCGSPEKVKLLEEKGVHHAINYNAVDYETEVKRLTNNEGVDVVLDAIGGTYFKKDMNIIRANGRVIGYGAAGLTGKTFGLIPAVFSMITFNVISMLMQSKGFFGVNMKRIGDTKPNLLQSELHQIMKLFHEGILKSEVSQVFPWDETGKATMLLENRKTTGKIILTIPE